ncbi:MAG TPA: glucokinase [Thermomonas sp.]|nr:glucokinase [Thermomonas beijingensis]HOC12040.1 glucokinase [Thermomonas sp.]
MGEAAGIAGDRMMATMACATRAVAPAQPCFIAADVGGTNARVSLVRTDANGALQVLSWQRYPCADYPSLAAILAEFVEGHPAREGIDCMVIASAGVVLDDEVINSNLPWRIKLAELRDSLHLRELHVVNDFAAAAHGVGRLGAADTRLLTPGVIAATTIGPALVVGAGTGLGAAVCIPTGHGVVVLPTEAGMAAFAPGNAREMEILAWLRKQGHRHVCTEQLLSGPGLVNLYRGLAELHGTLATLQTPAQIVQAAQQDEALALEAVLLFCGVLGSVIGDLAMITSAHSVYVAGGVVPQLIDFLPRSEFHARLVDKGAMRAVQERIPVRLVENEKLGVLGAASWYLQHLHARDHREQATPRPATTN